MPIEIYTFWTGLALGLLLGIGIHFLYNYLKAQNFARMISTLSRTTAKKCRELDEFKKWER